MIWTSKKICWFYDTGDGTGLIVTDAGVKQGKINPLVALLSPVHFLMKPHNP
ncbi:MAG: hypothetical protein KKE83_10685 [Proteobacteria bacterium]|nr:hypothetical protein [Pseudomonadota bacterium]MBU1547144.1 hypothetical protein [Pseudomonadota bacterium]MBU2620137.1 hypothetical protein [Pseudomonadota bacterium]